MENTYPREPLEGLAGTRWGVRWLSVSEVGAAVHCLHFTWLYVFARLSPRLTHLTVARLIMGAHQENGRSAGCCPCDPVDVPSATVRRCFTILSFAPAFCLGVGA